jgi:type III secretion system YscI/HrpB-like protein
MIEIVTNAVPSGAEARDMSSSSARADFGINGADQHGYDDFQMMVDDGDSHDSWRSEGASPLGDPLSGNDAMQLLRNVDAGKAHMQAALLRASMSPDQAGMHAAAVALSRYDLQTLLTSKIASKAFQAVDRLTNLQ